MHAIHRHLRGLKFRSSPRSSPSAGEHSVGNTHSFALTKTVSSDSDPELQSRVSHGASSPAGDRRCPCLRTTHQDRYFLFRALQLAVTRTAVGLSD